MPKVYCGEEQINVPPQEVKDAQVEKARELVAGWMKRRQEKRKFELRRWPCQSGEAIRQSGLVREEYDERLS